MESFAGLLLGWPALLAALVLLACGIARRRAVAVWAALVLSLPVAFYVSASPGAPLLGLVPLLALVLVAVTIRARARWPSRVGALVYAACVAALGIVVLLD